MTPFLLCVCREWLSKTRLNTIEYKITVFKPDVLNGKISTDPKRLGALKPVRHPI